MENNELKQVIRNYILENKEKMYEAPEDDQDDQDDQDDVSNGSNPANALIGQILQRNSELDDKLRTITQPDAQLQVIDAFVDFIIGLLPKGSLTNSRIQQHFNRKFIGTTNEEKVDEISTTAGAPAPATKYAFKLKKKKD